jgi:hypothetical protein
VGSKIHLIDLAKCYSPWKPSSDVTPGRRGCIWEVWRNWRSYLSSVLVTAITCGHPGNPINGLTQGNQFNLNDVVKFVCNPGYVTEGAVRSQCLASGQWSDTLPTCRSELPFLSYSLPSSSAIRGSVTPGAKATEFNPDIILIQTRTTWGREGSQMGTSSTPRYIHVKFHHGFCKEVKTISSFKSSLHFIE